MWKRVCEALYSVALNVLEEMYKSMPRKIADLIKQGGGGGEKSTDFMMEAYRYIVMFSLDSIKVCCCVFIEMYLIFIYKMLPDYTLI